MRIVDRPMKSETYRRLVSSSEAIVVADEAARGEGFFEALAGLSSASRLCVKAFRRSSTASQRRSECLGLPELSPEDVAAVEVFWRCYPWYIGRNRWASPLDVGRPRSLTRRDCERARARIRELVDQLPGEGSVTQAVDQAASEFGTGERVMWEVWSGVYKPRSGNAARKSLSGGRR